MTCNDYFDAKSPSDVDFYSVDFGDWLSVDTIISATVAATPSGLTVGTPVVANGLVAVEISNGADGTQYIVTYAITTLTGRSIQRSVILPVVNTSDTAYNLATVAAGTYNTITVNSAGIVTAAFVDTSGNSAAIAAETTRAELTEIINLTGATPYSYSTVGNVITEIINGVTVTTTLNSNTIVAVYGSPINQTWTTTISGASITTVRTS